MTMMRSYVSFVRLRVVWIITPKIGGQTTTSSLKQRDVSILRELTTVIFSLSRLIIIIVLFFVFFFSL